MIDHIKRKVCFSNFVKNPTSFGLLFLSDDFIILEINRWFFLSYRRITKTTRVRDVYEILYLFNLE